MSCGRTGSTVPMRDIFGIQDEVCAAIVGSLREKLTTAADYTPSRRPTHNLAAYDAYLKGTFHLNRLMPSDLRRGAALLEEATRADPEFTLALVGLSAYYSTIAVQGHAPSTEVLPRAEDLARRALQVDPQLPEAHRAFGLARLFQWDWPGAEAAQQRAMTLRPAYAQAYGDLAFGKSLRGECDLAVRLGEQAVALEPLDPMFGWFLTQSLCLAGDLERAVAQGKATIALDQTYLPSVLVGCHGPMAIGRASGSCGDSGTGTGWRRSAGAVDARLTGRAARSHGGGACHRPRAREEAAGRVDCWRSARGGLERCREDGSRSGPAGVLLPGAGCQLDSPAGALVRPATPGASVRGRDTSHRCSYADPCCRCLSLSNDGEQASRVNQVECWFARKSNETGERCG